MARGRLIYRELALLLEIFEQRCVDQRVIARRYFRESDAATRKALSRMKLAGNVVCVSRRTRGGGATAWSVTESGLSRLVDAGLVENAPRYKAELSPERVAHQLAMNQVGYLLGIRLTHEHQLTIPDAAKMKSRALPDAMFETAAGRRIYLEMDVGNYNVDHVSEKLNGIAPALGGWCELWYVTTSDERRQNLIAAVGERKNVSWFTFADVKAKKVPAEVADAVRFWRGADEIVAEVKAAVTQSPERAKVTA